MTTDSKPPGTPGAPALPDASGSPQIPGILGVPDIPKQESLIVYPSQFPIKVMGLKVDGLVAAITHVAHQFDPAFDASTIELRESSGGKYMGVTVTVTATSREQLDELYRTLSTHPMVKVVL